MLHRRREPQKYSSHDIPTHASLEARSTCDMARVCLLVDSKKFLIQFGRPQFDPNTTEFHGVVVSYTGTQPYVQRILLLLLPKLFRLRYIKEAL